MKKFLNSVLQWLIQVAVVALQPKVAPVGPGSDNLAKAILAYNNGLIFFKLTSVWTNGTSTIHKINQAQASAISAAVSKYAPKYGLPISYVCACLAIESALDPNSENKNTKPGGSNPTNDPMGYDEGVAQIKLKYLSDAQGKTAAERLAFALDVDKAIEYHCSIMAGNVAWAADVIKNNNSSVPDPRLSNKYILGTDAYNFGKTGMLAKYSAGEYPSHGQQVCDIEVTFAKALGVTPATAQPTA